MNTRSTSIASNTTADMNVSSNILHIPDDPTQEEPMPPWARVMIERIQALIDIVDRDNCRTENLESVEEPMPSWAKTLSEDLQDLDIKLDQHDIRLKNLESLDESDSWEDSPPQIEIPDEPINDYPHFSNFVPSSDHYL